MASVNYASKNKIISTSALNAAEPVVKDAYFAKVKKVNDVLNIEKVSEGKVGTEISIVVETEELIGKKIQINIRQGIENVIADQDASIPITFNEVETILAEAIVGEYENINDYSNISDLKDLAIATITLSPKERDKIEEWIEALDNADNHTTSLYLLIDAHSENGLEGSEVDYRGRNTDSNSVPNLWLDMDGKWFELSKEDRAPWMRIALEEARNAGGCLEGNEPLYSTAKNYLRFVGNRFEPTDSERGPWCAAYMNWCINEAGFNFARSGSSLAPISRNYRAEFTEIEEPIYGCIVVYKHVPVERTDEDGNVRTVRPWKGHTGFLYGMRSNGKYILLGGNQGNTIKLHAYGEYTGNSRTKRIHGFYIPSDYTPTVADELTEEERNMNVNDENAVIGVIGNSSQATT